MPGIGCPDVISSTMCAKDVGYGASPCCSPSAGAEGAEVGVEVVGAAEGNVAVEPSGGVWPGEGVAGRSAAGARPLGAVVGTAEGEGAVAR